MPSLPYQLGVSAVFLGLCCWICTIRSTPMKDEVIFAAFIRSLVFIKISAYMSILRFIFLPRAFLIQYAQELFIVFSAQMYSALLGLEYVAIFLRFELESAMIDHQTVSNYTYTLMIAALLAYFLHIQYFDKFITFLCALFPIIICVRTICMLNSSNILNNFLILFSYFLCIPQILILYQNKTPRTQIILNVSLTITIYVRFIGLSLLMIDATFDESKIELTNATSTSFIDCLLFNFNHIKLQNFESFLKNVLF